MGGGGIRDGDRRALLNVCRAFSRCNPDSLWSLYVRVRSGFSVNLTSLRQNAFETCCLVVRARNRTYDLCNFAEMKSAELEAEWREQLSEEEYRVTRQAGTERAFSSEMCGLFEPGIYACVCCGTELFDANNKFESHSGWASFTQPLKDNVAGRLHRVPYMASITLRPLHGVTVHAVLVGGVQAVGQIIRAADRRILGLLVWHYVARINHGVRGYFQEESDGVTLLLWWAHAVRG